ncbi:dTDP-4-dehydrorhamnose reductase [Arsukibacterium sp.]|uniref:dTDP-4-dehydrorhamnose reductase n=1 Tax=Arsukibacterium sp. TaxID=1977258 RepID=UPI001BD22E03|nr:dTDP-4-dehydrorhamnose reductase [Arsukibacterium sp.]
MKKIKLMLLGAGGQLGQCIQAEVGQFAALELVSFSHQQLDVTKLAALQQVMTEVQPAIVINCVAYTAVDNAETDPGNAYLLNCDVVADIATLCLQQDAGLIHISTDYVFNGQHYRPYQESDLAAPVGQYGASKLAGEQALLQAGVAGVILRTSWLYSEFGNNFVKTMLKLARSRSQLGVVADQIASPTYGRDLAQAILTLANQADFCQRFTPAKVYHYANQGVASWFDFAKAIFEFSNQPCQVQAITTEAYPTPARRPAYSVLNTAAIRQDLQLPIPYWRDSLRRCLTELATEL